MTHECPAPECGVEADLSMLMCPGHWYQVPKPLRAAVWRAWRRGAGAGSPAHAAAMRAAIGAVSRASSPVLTTTRSELCEGAAAGRGLLPSDDQEVIHRECQ